MQVSKLIQDVSLDLNDQVVGHEYMRWSFDQLFSYYSEILPELARAASWLFVHTVVVPLAYGNVWQHTCECTHILRVLGESTENGELIHDAQETSNDNIYIWPDYTIPNRCNRECCSSSPFTSFSINRISDSQFKVYPPISPSSARRYALVECYREPDSTDKSFSVPEQIVKAIKQWMLYRAMIIDSENNADIRNVATTHLQAYQNAYAILKAEQKEIEDRRNGNDTVRTVQDSTANQVPPRA